MIGVQYVYNSLDGEIVIPNPIPAHWAFDHTAGLFNSGQTLPGLLGYEIDGYQGNCPGYTPPANILATLVTLGHSPWSRGLIVCGEPVTKAGYSDMTIYTASSGAQVLATGSMQWNWGLDDFGFGQQFPWSPSQPSPFGPSRVHPAAQQMTHNLLRTFAGRIRVPVIFANADTSTSGDWPAVYRPDVYKIANWTPDILPSYVSSVTIEGSALEGVMTFLAASVAADTPAFVLGSVLTNQPVSFTGTRGWQFGRAGGDYDILITQLGVFDHGGDGLVNSHEIGLWRAGNVTGNPARVRYRTCGDSGTVGGRLPLGADYSGAYSLCSRLLCCGRTVFAR